MINIENLSFKFGRKRPDLYGGVSACFEEGRIYGLFGKNGTGKSTLTYLIAGLLRPTSGRVTCKGVDTYKLCSDFLEDTILVAEEFDLPAISCSDYIKANASFYPNFSLKDMEQNLKDFNVVCNKRLSELSMGQKKKFLMSFALASGCSLLLMDEPTNGMDIPSKSIFRRMVSRSMSDNRTIIISTHQAHDLETLIDSVAILDNCSMLLNSSIYDIEKKLYFVHNSDSVPSNAIYSNQKITGYQYITENSGNKESDVSLEMLFNATLVCPDVIANIINSNNQ